MELRKLEGKVRLYGNCTEPGGARWRNYQKILFKLDNGAEIELEDLLVPADIKLATYRPVVFYLFRPHSRTSYFLYAAKTQAGKRVGLDTLRHYLREGPFSIPMDHQTKILDEAVSLLNEDDMMDGARSVIPHAGPDTSTHPHVKTTDKMTGAHSRDRLARQVYSRPEAPGVTIINM